MTRRGPRLGHLALAVLVALAVALPVEFAPRVLPLLSMDTADAQSRRSAPTERRSFFDMLFGSSRRTTPAPPPRAVSPAPSRRSTTRRRSSTSRSTASSSTPAPAAVEILPKEEGALVILVIGDFIGSAVARGLEETFAEEPKVAVNNATNGNSGLVRDDYYDWAAVLPGLLNDQQPDVVVVAIGGNDRQQLSTADGRFAPLTEGWDAAYTQRVEGIAETLSVYNHPFFWVGSPPMRSSSFSRDMVHINALFKSVISEKGGFFVDVWNGFADADGRYVSSGPDVDGNLRALRNKDGINFTRAGRVKLAFYVEREMKRQIGFGADSADVLLASTPTAKIEVGADGVKRLVGPIMSLSGARPGAREELAGAGGAAPPKVEDGNEDVSAYQTMVIVGGSLPVVPGRADDFSWPPPGAAAAAPDLDRASGV